VEVCPSAKFLTIRTSAAACGEKRKEESAFASVFVGGNIFYSKSEKFRRRGTIGARTSIMKSREKKKSVRNKQRHKSLSQDSYVVERKLEESTTLFRWKGFFQTFTRPLCLSLTRRVKYYPYGYIRKKIRSRTPIRQRILS